MKPSFLPPRRPRSGHRTAGVALVITLILLSIITFMAVTFLVVSRSQRNAVTHSTDQTMARQAAETALNRALADLVTGIQSTTNEHNYDLRVSTNYYSAAGFNPGGAAFTSPTNVNYDYLMTGGSVIGNNALQNIANLLYNPRPPVYISNDFRYYLDLNRNGRYDTNGLLPEINPLGGFYDLSGKYTTIAPPGNTLSNFYVGDPEWVGGLERPEFRHSSSNRFLFRYAYIALPAGKSLDLNYIHNYAKFLQKTMRASDGDGFLRNQGIGPFEINLAAFLVDLNTNYWPFPEATKFGTPYAYVTNLTQPNTGTAFDDAAALLRYRYGATAPNFANGLLSVQKLFDDVGAAAFKSDLLDNYSAGPLMVSDYNVASLVAGNRDPDSQPLPPPDRTQYPWPGADNPNHFFTLQGLYDPNTTAIDVGNMASFTDRLWRAGTNTSSYDRYTFYRLASQLGTDTASEVNKLNINYCNVDDRGEAVPNKATSFIAWKPVQFFTNAANRLLANAGYNFNVDNIQIWPTNMYTPSVHRLLQLAANIYDATTTNALGVISDGKGPAFPSVFRPLFYRTNNTIFINGYVEETDDRMVQNPPVPYDLNNPNDRNSITRSDRVMVYGVPLVIGARKGFPNFNEFAMQTQVRVTRRLEFRRPNNPGVEPLPVNETNQMYTLSISNVLGVEAWNSYTNAYQRGLELRVAADTAAVLTNEFREILLSNWVSSFPKALTIPAGTWQGYNSGKPTQIGRSFLIPLTTNFLFLTNVTYRDSTRRFVLETSLFERNPGSPNFTVPHWWLQLKTRVRFYLVDTQEKRIVDYVNLESTEDPVDLADVLMRNNTTDSPQDYCGQGYTANNSAGAMWCTNRLGNPTDVRIPTYGIMNQWWVCYGKWDVSQVDWNAFVFIPPAGLETKGAIDHFRVQFDAGPVYFPNKNYTKTNLFYSPFSPTRTVYYFTTWQANDPLVHYTIGDLMAVKRTNRWDFTTSDSSVNNLGVVNGRYEPWSPGLTTDTATDPTVKDPLVFESQSWDFPTNKFPSIGWLGRVHRGTPWQTVYLKYARMPNLRTRSGAPDPDLVKWRNWTGNDRLVRNVGQMDTNVVRASWSTNSYVVPDAAFTHPVYDRYILDLFTASTSDNIARGQMSINQNNLAAWSAVLSGVVALTNTSTASDLQKRQFQQNPVFRPKVIDPAGVYDPVNTNTWPQVVRLVQAINAVRATNNNLGVFTRLGDILAVPELTLASPFLNTNGTSLKQYGISEAAYERLPQQILGLLQCEPAPRFVIYAYGQALKPADRSLVTASGPYFQLCTNYQVTAEVATRTVVRLEGVPYRFPSSWREVAPGKVVGVADPNLPYPGTNTPAYDKLRAVVESFNVLPPD